MKRIFKMIIFSAVAVYATSLWNKGFVLPSGIDGFLKLVLVFAIVYYLLVPISKIILLPLNIITLGLVSFLVYLLLLHLASHSFSLLTIKDWTFGGLNFWRISIGKTYISYFWNLVLSSLSLSSIIGVLEKVL